jgi:hypothetical protein
VPWSIGFFRLRSACAALDPLHPYFIAALAIAPTTRAPTALRAIAGARQRSGGPSRPYRTFPVSGQPFALTVDR